MLISTTKINEWYKRKQFRILIIYGPSGRSKSVYAWKIIEELYPEESVLKDVGVDPVLDEGRPLWEDGPQYDDIRKYLLFKPVEVLNFSKYMRAHRLRNKAMILDDAGLWFSAESWKDPWVVAALKWIQVARSITSCLILTTTSPFNLVRRLRSLDLYTIKINESDSMRVAKAYAQTTLPNGMTYVSGCWEDRFHYVLRNDLYSWYKPVRDAYLDEVNIMMEKAVEDMKKDGNRRKVQRKALLRARANSVE